MIQENSKKPIDRRKLETMKIDTLDTIGPLDGRYRKTVAPLAPIFGERGLIERRAIVENQNLLALSDHNGINKLRKFTAKEKRFLRLLHFRARRNAHKVKQYEKGKKGRKGVKKTEHDVAALVLYLREEMLRTSLHDTVGWMHFPLTSEDVNNIAYALQLRDGLEQIIIPALEKVWQSWDAFAVTYDLLAMLAATHGQPAPPTTLGKEFRVFAVRLGKKLDQLRRHTISAKFNGATGTWGAHLSAFPKVDWPAFSRDFITSFNKGHHSVLLVPNLVTTQIEPHDTYGELFDLIKEIAVILVAFCQDVWQYISDDWLIQKVAAGEVGSSTIPAKVNPITFENAEGNLLWLIGLCETLARVLPISRRQRHLSDSTIIRNFGVAFGHCLQACVEIVRGMGKISPNPIQIRKDLRRHPEVTAEAVQVILRREGIANAYDQLKELTRGKKTTRAIMKKFVKNLRVKPSVKRELMAITPMNYIGLAAQIARRGQPLLK